MEVTRSRINGRNKLILEFASLFRAGRGGFFLRVKEMAPDSLPILGYDAFPFAALLNKVNANRAGFVVALHRFVDPVLAWCRDTKFADSIVRTVSVSMVDLVRTPLAVDVEPRQNVCGVVHSFLDLDSHVTALLMGRTRKKTCVSRVPVSSTVSAFSPSEEPGIRVVDQNRANKLSRKWRMNYFWHRVLRIGRLKVSLTPLPIECNASLRSA